MTLEKRTVLVTGAAGFIGHHLVARLLHDGFTVVGVDNFLASSRENLNAVTCGRDFVLAEGDIRDAGFVKETLSTFKPKVIFHLAAIHFIPLCESDPAQTLAVNIVGTQNLLDALQDDTERFIFASTGDVYVPSSEPHKESDALGSLNIYGLSKAFSEESMKLAQKKNPRRKYLSLRFFNTYGPGETNPHVLPDICACLRQGNNLTLGNTKPLRDYIFVDDLVDGIVRAASYEGSAWVMNLGTGVTRSVDALLKVIRDLLQRDVTVSTDPARIRPVERQVLCADPSLAAAALGWSAVTRIETGLRRTLEAERVDVAAPATSA